MARRPDEDTGAVATADAPEVVNEVPSAPVDASPADVSTEPTVEASDSTVTEPATGETPSAPAAEEVIDLSGFMSAVNTAVESKDAATGEITDENALPVKVAYGALSGTKAKNAAKSALSDGVKDGMNKMDIQLARAYMQLTEAIKTSAPKTKKESAPAVPVDPTEALVTQLTGFSVAEHLLLARAPEGIDGDAAQDKVDAALTSELLTAAEALYDWTVNTAEDKGDAPESSPVVQVAVKLALGKSPKAKAVSTKEPSTFTGERRNIAKHIEEAFAGEEAGKFLTIAQIRAFNSAEYGEDHPSAGAISARLFPSSGKCTITGVTPGQSAEGNKGATKN